MQHCLNEPVAHTMDWLSVTLNSTNSQRMLCGALAWVWTLNLNLCVYLAIGMCAYEAGFQRWKHGKKTKVALIFEAKEKQMEQEGTDEHVYAEERNNKPKTRKKINVCKEYLYIYSFIYFLFIHFVFGLCMFILAFFFSFFISFGSLFYLSEVFFVRFASRPK